MKVNVSCTQMRCDWDIQDNIQRAEKLILQAADQGAQIILLQELFETPYFPIDQQAKHFDLASVLDDQTTIKKMRKIAKKLKVVLPISFFERSGQVYYNSVVIIDADGEIVGHYRKSHIPQFPGYEEKFYFSPGDTGFKAIQTRYGCLGVGICWDQWFPEAARIMVLKGAEILLYPTAIGSEIFSPDLDSKDHWQSVMCGHAAANIVPVISSNRIGKEVSGANEIEFYGSSFICDHKGKIIKSADKTSESVLTHTFDLNEIRDYRRSWGVFRDRRTSLYGSLLLHDGAKT
jgi:N-carbamoylputrescine amidase